MSSRTIYAISGLVVGAVVEVLLNLVAAAIQQQGFADRFDTRAVVWLVGFSVFGLFVGYWLSKETQMPTSDQNGAAVLDDAKTTRKTVTITRLQAILSKIKLRGRGAHLRDIFSFGSQIDIDTRD